MCVCGGGGTQVELPDVTAEDPENLGPSLRALSLSSPSQAGTELSCYALKLKTLSLNLLTPPPLKATQVHHDKPSQTQAQRPWHRPFEFEGYRELLSGMLALSRSATYKSHFWPVNRLVLPYHRLRSQEILESLFHCGSKRSEMRRAGDDCTELSLADFPLDTSTPSARKKVRSQILTDVHKLIVLL